ncbi:TetR family transcriptional regulator [Natranaerovirga pectinivora]|uniref:TetR family transcriptional regulator n=1 Tax=Natranaerovirga pectinivora TaxID=682400 RepID=A0A4R3MEW9_9FIRM|nr:TetR/AcrR family transcriptional regulator [Natranaerovirga pectinivora]TCT12214.1 TetR family transcriptional regulator [Natranaerovirga pectinivora]
MKTRKKQIDKDLIIETTLALIEKNEGLKDVNLRGIAKAIGCAHTNLYNYFQSFNEIIWEALGRVILKMIAYVETNVGSEIEDDEKIFMLFASVIDFSMDHPGWFRLMWLEEIDGEPPNEVIQILSMPGEGLKGALMKASGNKLTEERAIIIEDILYTYIHGELCKWINNRSFTNNPQETKEKWLSNLKELYSLLMDRG